MVFADGSTVNLKEIGLTIHQENHSSAPTQQVYTSGTDYNDVIYGRDGRDTIRGWGGNDLVYGNGGVDNIYGGDGDDTLYGESGDDNIYGNDGNDSMYGGLGDDYLEGGNGSDTYYWNWGDGFDIIDDDGEESDIDKIVFGAGITFEDLTFRQYYNKPFQIIVKGDETQGIELIYQDFTGNTGSYEHRGIEQLVFADGSVVNLKEIGLVIHNEDDEFSANSTNYVYGTDYNDVIYGSAGREQISTYDGDDIIYGNDGNDIIYSYDGDDCLYGGNGNDYLSAGEGNDVLDGGAGDDDLLGGKGNDILAGGAGNDVLNGDYGDDIYVYNIGDGLDTIDDRQGSETIKFGENITQSNLTYSQDSNNLVININNNSEQGIIIEDYFYSAAYKNKTIEFADGSTFDLSNADQLIQAMSSFAANSASTMDEICNPVANVSEMCPLSANPDLLKQAI